MSDDRMDRAERIRNMREGNRGTEEESTDETESDTASSGQPAQSPTTEQTQQDPEPTTEAETPAGTPEQDAAETTGGTQTDVGAETQAQDDDAAAVAQRAAAAAAEVTGSSSGDEDAEPAGADPVAGAAAGGLTGQGPTGVELPDQQLLEEAMADSAVESTEGGARAAIEGESSQSEELVRVLEFSLGDEYYCLDIEYVEEIVKRNAVTRVPNTPEFVDGVVDLRGQITTILEPKEMMDIDAEGEQNLIIVFDPDQFEEQGAVGWVVDEVRQVVPVTESEVNSPPVDADYINGVVDREEYEQFVIWVEPDDALAQATSTEEE